MQMHQKPETPNRKSGRSKRMTVPQGDTDPGKDETGNEKYGKELHITECYKRHQSEGGKSYEK